MLLPGWLVRRRTKRDNVFRRLISPTSKRSTISHTLPSRPISWLKADADEDGIGGDAAVGVLRYLIATKSCFAAQRELHGL
jgi:hypothetical protein